MRKGSTGKYIEIAVDHTTHLLRRVVRTYRLHDRLPTHAHRSMTNEVRSSNSFSPSSPPHLPSPLFFPVQFVRVPVRLLYARHKVVKISPHPTRQVASLSKLNGQGHRCN